MQLMLFSVFHLLGKFFFIPLLWAYVYICMWDGVAEYSTPMGFDFLSNLPVCVFWLGHLAHLYLRLILLSVNLILPFWFSLMFCPLVDAVFHCVNGLNHLVCFWIGWYGLFLSLFSASIMNSSKPGLVVKKSLSNCLSIKDFLSP